MIELNANVSMLSLDCHNWIHLVQYDLGRLEEQHYQIILSLLNQKLVSSVSGSL